MSHNDFDVVTGPSMAQRRDGLCVSGGFDRRAERLHRNGEGPTCRAAVESEPEPICKPKS